MVEQVLFLLAARFPPFLVDHFGNFVDGPYVLVGFGDGDLPHGLGW